MIRARLELTARDIKPHSSRLIGRVCLLLFFLQEPSLSNKEPLISTASDVPQNTSKHRWSHHLISRGMGYQEIIHPFSKPKMQDLH
jgi:hypothetical protein